jgi:hypothetical protein
MRWFMLFLAAAFFGTLTAVAGARAVVEVQSFVLGIVCGLAASIPASVLAFFLSRTPAAPVAPPEPQNERGYPPLVIVNGPAPARAQRPPEFPIPATHESAGPAPRYRVVGDE